MRKRISVVTPCYNEEENALELYKQIKEVFDQLPQYDYEHIYIDNSSKDETVRIVKEICRVDPNVKLIVNVRNFGHIRSPFHGLLQANGDAVILMVSDLQDPPTMIKDFIEKWEEGFKVVLGVKVESEETAAMFAIRKLYYNFINRISDIELTRNNTGFGLYDKEVISILKDINDPYPYFRGLISDIGFESFKIPYKQPSRKRGITKNNFYTLYDMAMLGITNHSKIPLRLATIFGFALSFVSLLVAVVYFILKLLLWKYIPFGIAPLVIGMFFFASVQLFFIGMLGEYVGAVHTQVLKRPLVIEKERVNFVKEESKTMLSV
ncbi:glycosyltransferase family 2 protein [Paenibacillus sp. GCM10027626]|uniref:glycosyltransferase family 2 protein n=1 Tax=Paenibacillus sp. GCM10027626 TaxID=3273411 RepID=UPI00362B965F